MSRPILGPHSGSKEALIAFAKANGSKRLSDVQDFVDELFAQPYFDGFMIAVQSIHETDGWTSPYWVNHLNPAGLAITFAGQASKTWGSGSDAACAVLVHHSAYTGFTLPKNWEAWIALDPHYKEVFTEKLNGTAKVWSDYGSGKWATDPQYYEGILKREQEVRAFETGVKPAMTTPTILDRYLHVAQLGYPAVEKRYKGRFGMQPKIIVLHIQEGNNLGSWQHFHAVSASSTVLIGKNGDIWRLVPEEDAPWTNGDVMSPTSKGWDIINTYGADPNVYTLSIETEGFTGEWPKPQAELDSVLWQIREWMTKYNIPLDRVIRHADVNQVTRPNCPGQEYYDYIITELKKDQTPSKPSYGTAQPVKDADGKLWDGSEDIAVGNVTFYADKKKVTAANRGEVRTFATTSSAQTRQPLKANESFNVLGWVKGEAVKGEDRWWITTHFSRINVTATKEKPTDRDVPEALPDAPEGTLIYKGVVYYPASLDGEERELTVVRRANLRESATTKSKVVGIVNKGDKLKAAYWCFGDEILNENVWWILSGDNAIKESPRLWCAATMGRPD